VVHYGPWLGKFCASVCWRVLYLHQRLCLKNLTHSQHGRVHEALGTWSDIIDGKKADPDEFELHLVPVDVLSSARGLGWPPNMSRYLARAVEMDVVSTRTSAFVYAKLCKLLLVGFVEMKYPQEWIGSRLSMERGIVQPQDRGLPTNFGRYLGDR